MLNSNTLNNVTEDEQMKSKNSLKYKVSNKVFAGKNIYIYIYMEVNN